MFDRKHVPASTREVILQFFSETRRNDRFTVRFNPCVLEHFLRWSVILPYCVGGWWAVACVCIGLFARSLLAILVLENSPRVCRVTIITVRTFR